MDINWTKVNLDRWFLTVQGVKFWNGLPIGEMGKKHLTCFKMSSQFMRENILHNCLTVGGWTCSPRMPIKSYIQVYNNNVKK